MIGRKMGMMHVWNALGILEVCTVVHLDNVQVVKVQHHISSRGRPFIQVQLGSANRKLKTTKKHLLVHCRKAGVEPKYCFKDFVVTPNAVLPLGHKLSARHFVPGQFVDVQGITRGRGFQGAMYRWGFAGQPASHGVSKTHRSLGATGCRQDPGKTWKGKKMHGKMGNKNATMRNLQVFKVDTKRDLVFVKGTIPGARGSFLRLRDATFKAWNANAPPPFPTYVPKPGDEADEVVMDLSHLDDPFEIGVI